MAVISNQTLISGTPEQVLDHCVDTGRVEPAEGGARLLVDFGARPRGWLFRVLFPLFVLMMKRQGRRT